MGIVREDGVVKFHSFVRPEIEVDPGTMKRFGLRAKDLSDVPALDDIWEILIKQIDGPVYGYHIGAHKAALQQSARTHEIEGGGQALNTVEWRDLKQGALWHNAVKGERPTLRRTCQNLEVEMGQQGLKGATNRADLCRRLHRELLKDAGEVSSTYRSLGPASPKGNPKESPDGERDRSERFNQGRGDNLTKDQQHLLRRQKRDGGKRPVEDERHPAVFISLSEGVAHGRRVPTAIAALSDAGKVLLDTRVRPSCPAPPNPQGSESTGSSPACVDSSEPVGSDTTAAPSLGRILAHLLPSLIHRDVWAYSPYRVQTLLLESIDPGTLPESSEKVGSIESLREFLSALKWRDVKQLVGSSRRKRGSNTNGDGKNQMGRRRTSSRNDPSAMSPKAKARWCRRIVRENT